MTVRLIALMGILFCANAFAATVTLTAKSGPNGTVTPSGAISATTNTPLTLTAVPAAGFDVDVWYLNDTVAQTGGTSYIASNSADSSVLVTFKPSANKPYTYTIKAGANGKVSPMNDIQLPQNGTALLTAAPDPNYSVDTWYVDGVAQSPGAIQITLTAARSQGSVVVTFVVNTQFGRAPTFRHPSDADNQANPTRGTMFSYTLIADGSPPPTFSISDADANDLRTKFGLVISNDTISGIPIATGKITVTLIARNGISPDAVKDLVITIRESESFNQPAPLNTTAFKAFVGPHAPPYPPDGMTHTQPGGHNTVGYDFDLNLPDAQRIFEKALPSVTFADVKKGSVVTLTDAQMNQLFITECNVRTKQAQKFVGSAQYDLLPEPIKEVIMDNLFQGIYGIKFFKGSDLSHLRKAFKEKDYSTVLAILSQSSWAAQYPDRARDCLSIVQYAAGLASSSK